jgi:hypothetical protein
LRVAAEPALFAVVFARDIVAAMLCGGSAPIAAIDNNKFEMEKFLRMFCEHKFTKNKVQQFLFIFSSAIY